MIDLNLDQARTMKKLFEDKLLMLKMDFIQDVCKLGHQKRAEAKIPLRQPLAKATISIPDELVKEFNILSECIDAMDKIIDGR